MAKQHKFPKGSRRWADGFSIVEVLVTIIIIGTGLLVAARMQMMSIQNTQGGYMQAQASNIGYDIVDRMRVNLEAVNDGDYAIAAADADPAVIDCKGSTADCSTDEMAQYDVYWWRRAIGATLPSGTGAIATVQNGTITEITVTVAWFDPYTAADGAESSVFRAELPR